MALHEKARYRCRACDWSPSDNEPDGAWEHCPNCLSGIHEADEDGYACGGTLEPIAIWAQPDDKWEVVQRCALCGEISSSHITEDDNPIMLLSLASRPLSAPPFPLEKMETITALLGTRGSVEGYYYE